MGFDYDLATGTVIETKDPDPYRPTYDYDLAKGAVIENPGKGDDRSFVDKLTDFASSTQNVVANLAKAGVDFFAPGSEAALNVDQFIESNRKSQSPYLQSLVRQRDELVRAAQESGDTGFMAWLGKSLEAPVTTLGPEVVGNLATFAIPGGAAGTAGRLGARALGATELGAAAAGSRAALGTTSAMGGLIGAGGVRGGVYEDVMKAPEDRLQAENPEYRELLGSGMDPVQARRQLAGELTPRTAGMMGLGAGVGLVSGRLGAESALFGRGGGLIRTPLIEAGTEAFEEAVQQGAQNYATQALLPSTSLTEGVGLAAGQGAVIGAGGGAAAGVIGGHNRPAERDPTPPEIFNELARAPDVDSVIATATSIADEMLDDGTLPRDLYPADTPTPRENGRPDDLERAVDSAVAMPAAELPDVAAGRPGGDEVAPGGRPGPDAGDAALGETNEPLPEPGPAAVDAADPVDRPQGGDQPPAQTTPLVAQADAISAPETAQTRPSGTEAAPGDDRITIGDIPNTGNYVKDTTDYLTKVVPEKFTAYRSVWVKPGEKPDLDNPGAYWAETREGASRSGFPPDGERSQQVILAADVNRADIDVKTSIMRRRQYGEPEIVLKANPKARIADDRQEGVKSSPDNSAPITGTPAAEPTGNWRPAPREGLSNLTPGTQVRQGNAVGTVLPPSGKMPPGSVRVQWNENKAKGVIRPEFAAGLQYQAPRPAFSRAPAAPDTPEFKRFFQGSKVVDEKGAPLVVYHGTTQDFDTFSPESHFGTAEAASKRLRMRNASDGASIVPAYLSIKNPKRVSDRAIHGKKSEWNWAVDTAKLEGHDGIVYANKVEGGDSYIAFSPTQIKSATGNNGQFDPANPDIRFSRADADPTVQPRDASGKYTRVSMEQRVARVQHHLDATLAGAKNAPKVQIIETIDQAPTDVKEAAKSGGGAPEGFIHNGTVYLVADQLKSSEDVKRVVLHETFGHHGLRGFFGDKLNDVLDKVAASRPADTAARLANEPHLVEMAKTDLAQAKRQAAEEVLAYWAEQNPKHPMIKRVIATVRNAMRSLGFKLELSDNDIVNNILVPARRFVERGGPARTSGPTAFKRAEGSSFDSDNRTGVVVGAKPGEFGWNFTKPDTPPPPIQAPTQAGPRLEKIGPAVHKILTTKGFKDLAKQAFGIEGLQLVPLHGSWEGKPEPSFMLSAPGMTFEQADSLSRMLGFAFAQDATVVTQPVTEQTPGEIPAFYVGNDKRLSDAEITKIVDAAKAEGLDYSSTVDGRAVKFLYFGDEAGLDEFAGKVRRIQDAGGLKHFNLYQARSSLNEAADYLSTGDGSNRGEARGNPSWAGSPDLFGRTVDHLIVPYAKAVGGEGYRFSVQRFAERFGLTDAQRDLIRDRLIPKSGVSKSTVPIASGAEQLDIRPSGKPDKKGNRKASVNDILYALQNRSAQQGLIEPGDYSDRTRKVIAEAMADEVIHHIQNPKEGKTAIGWYDTALKAAKKAYYRVFPELETDRDKAMLFDALWGITSQGNDVFSNSQFGGRVYQMVRDGYTIGEAVAKLKGSFGGETRAIENNLLKLEELIDRNGYDVLRKFFNTKGTVGSINAALRKAPNLNFKGKPLRVEGAADQTVSGWMVFGPKIGSFINNLHGDYSTLTADLWFSRTWNRILGYSFVHTPATEAAQYQRFIETVAAELQQSSPDFVGPKNPDAGKDVERIGRERLQEALENPYTALALAGELEAEFRKGGYKIKSELRRAGKVWTEARESSVAAPRGDKEREFQQRTAETTQAMVKKKTGIDITIADIQAALWFYEKDDLFMPLGGTNKKSEGADYAGAATELLKTYDNGDLYFNKTDGVYVFGSKGSYLNGGHRKPGVAFSRAQEGTPEFKRWFGQSKVVDADGKPLVMYHGTRGDVASFDSDRIGENFRDSKGGFFFSGSPVLASAYAGRRGGEGGNVVPAYLSLQNPLTLDQYLWSISGTRESELTDRGFKVSDLFDESADAIIEYAKLEGKDGLHWANGKDILSVAFHPEQIKSATGNSGAFDPADPRIAFSRKQESTPEFRRWFGKSKVVDADGKPLVVYHGTRADFAAFDSKEIDPTIRGWGGFHFSTDPKRASGFSGAEGGQIMPVYLSLKNPYLLKQEEARTFQGRYGKYGGDKLRADFQSRGYDGFDVGGGHYVAFEPTQIKSATGNSGAFDPADPRIAFSRATPIVNAIRDWTTTSNGFNVLHRTLGTQFHKAEINATFKRTFDAVQRHLAHVSRFANEASDLIPTIFPKIETLRDIVRKKRASDKDMSKVGEALYAGTLADPNPAKGKIWSDAELASQFGMTPSQIGLYRQARLAIDKSLDDLGKAEMVRAAGGAMKDQVMNAATVADAQAILAGAGLTKEQMADVDEKAKRITELKAGGYMPLMRFGKYSVYVTDAAGNQVSFQLFDRERDANKAARDMAGPGLTVTRSTLPQEVYELFAGISPDTLEVFATAANIPQTAATQEFLKQARNQRSASKRLIHRKGVAGFSEDLPRVLASFITSNSRAIATALENKEMLQSVEDAKKGPGDVADEAAALVKAVNNPFDPSAKIRGLMFVQYLGGSIASALVNMTQPLMMSFPYLSQHLGTGKAAAHLTAALKDVANRAGMSPALQAAVRQAEKAGHISPQEIHHLIGEATPGFGGSHKARRALFAWGRFFSMAEEFNRRVTFIAAYKGAVEKKIPNPYEFAVKTIAATQGIYNKGNRPNWARNPVGATVLTFKQYSISYAEFLVRLPPKERMLALGMLALAAGLQGLPGADDLDDLVDTLLQKMGINKMAKEYKREAIEAVVGKDAAELILHGVSGALPIDVSNRLGMGNLMPGSGMLLQGRGDKSRDVAEFLGVSGSAAMDLFKAVSMGLTGDVGGAANQIAPKMAKDIVKGVQMADKGYYPDAKGRRQVDTTTSDAVWKAIGFQPSVVANESEERRTRENRLGFAKEVEARITDDWAKALRDKDTAAAEDARRELVEWNASNPNARIAITGSQLKTKLKNLQMDAMQRQSKRTPREMRQ